MDKEMYLKQLKEKLTSLSNDEREEAIKYYEEYFDEAGDDQKVIEDLGMPDHLAENILKEYNVKNEKKKEIVNEANNRTAILIISIILCIMFAPVIFPIIMAIVGIILSVPLAGLGIFIASIFAVSIAIALFTTSAYGGMVALGIGLILLSISIVLIVLGIKIIPMAINGIVWLFRKLFKLGGNK